MINEVLVGCILCFSFGSVLGWWLSQLYELIRETREDLKKARCPPE